jgi:hypothetical protein
MESEKIQVIMDKLVSLRELAGDDAAQSYLAEIYPTLPEGLQREIALLTFMDAMKKEVDTRETIAQIQEEGITAIDALEKMKGE